MRKIVLLISSLAFLAGYQISAVAAGISITEYRAYNVVHQSLIEDFSPTSTLNGVNNIGTWSFNDIDKGQIDHDNGFGKTVSLGDGKYAWQISEWSASHPSFGTHTRSSPFTGDYIKKNVVSLSFEARVVNDIPMRKGRPITLVLRGHDGFTLYKTLFYCEPDGNEVDCENGSELPTNWTKYTFSIPKTFAQAKQEGWGIYNLKDIDDDYKLQHYFNSVMSDVQKVDFMFGAPRVLYGIQEFHIEATRVTITTALKH